MLQPIHTPIAGRDRITALHAELVRSLSTDLILTTLGVRRVGCIEALVIIHRDDAVREPISAHDARRLAVDLRATWSGVDRKMVEWADSLDEAAEAAERQASAILLSQAAGRKFGGR